MTKEKDMPVEDAMLQDVALSADDDDNAPGSVTKLSSHSSDRKLQESLHDAEALQVASCCDCQGVW